MYMYSMVKKEQKKMGRPAKTVADRRSEYVTVAVTPGIKEAIRLARGTQSESSWLNDILQYVLEH